MSMVNSRLLRGSDWWQELRQDGLLVEGEAILGHVITFVLEHPEVARREGIREKQRHACS